MPLYDLPLEELQEYNPEPVEPADFDAFWTETLAQAREHQLNATFEPVDYGLCMVDTYDVTYNGYGGQPIKSWLVVPRHRSEPLPCVVDYIGYGAGRSYPPNFLLWSSVGYANLVMDTRGQGGSVWPGHTPDVEPDPAGPQFPGFMTRGVQAPRNYFYRRVFTDAVRAVEAARSHPVVDPDRVAVSGGSQGGGIALAAAGLAPDVAALMADVPFLCHYKRATEITDDLPYAEISAYLRAHRDRVETVFKTLSYFDGVNFAARATAPALFSVGLMDTICPPSTVFAAYNRYGGEKEIKAYPYNGHEGGDIDQTMEKIAFLRRLWD